MDENKEFVVLDNTGTQVGESVIEPIVELAPAEPVIEPIVGEEEKILKNEDKAGLENNIEIENNIEDFKKNSDDEEDNEEDGSDSENKEETDDEKKKKVSKNSLEDKFALLEQELNDTKAELETLKAENASLNAFKAEVEDKEKDELINSFYMLSDEDKKNVIENKSNFTLDEIEKELSVICVRKKVNFNLDDEKETTEKVVPTTFNLNGTEESDLPAWLKAVENYKKNAE